MKLTRAGIVLLVLTLFFLSQSASSAATIFVVGSVLLGLIVLNIPYALVAVRGIRVRREHASHVKEGTDMQVKLHVENPTRAARILLRLFDGGPAGSGTLPVQVPFLPKRSDAEIDYRCRAGRRGIYRFCDCWLESSSPFGLVNARRRARTESDLVVYPLFYELAGMAFPFRKTFTGMTAAPGSRPGEGASFFGLREYRHGDPIRKIHWASSLRARSLMVKEFEEDMHSSVAILLDTHEPAVVGDGDTNLEVAIRVAASLANHTLVNGHPTLLVHHDRATGQLRQDKAMGDLTPVLDSLARLEPSSEPPASLVAAGMSASKHSNWIVILLSADHDAMEALLRVRARGTEIMLVVVDDHGTTRPPSDNGRLPAMLDLLEAAGINTILMSRHDDIQSTLCRDLKPARRVKL